MLAVDPVGLHHCAYRLILGRHVSENRLDAITLPTDLPANRPTRDWPVRLSSRLRETQVGNDQGDYFSGAD